MADHEHHGHEHQTMTMGTARASATPRPQEARQRPREDSSTSPRSTPAPASTSPTSWPSSMSTRSPTAYGQIIHRTPMPNVGDELHHFGWNACSSLPRRTSMKREHLIVPGFRSSRIHIVDVAPTRASPRSPR